MRINSSLLTLASLCVVAEARAQDLVLPAAFATQMGSTANRIPHGRHLTRYQQVFLGSEINNGGGYRMTGLSLRVDEQFTGSSGTYDYTIRLGPTQRDHTNLTTDFAGNFSGPQTTVFSGSFNLPASPAGGTPTSWLFTIPFATDYTHRGGNNLLVEWINSSSTSNASFLDFCLNEPGCTTAQCFAFDPTAATATSLFMDRGLIMRFTGMPMACPTELQTLYAANNGGSAGGAVYFDLTVNNTTTITAFCVNTTVAVGNPIGLTVYTNTTVPTWVGNHTDPNWTQVAIDDGTATSVGANVGSNVPLLAPLTLTPGTYPMALVGTGTGGSFNHRYTNGNGSNQNYADGSLAISLGGASNVPFAGSAFNPRVWNGAIKYLSSDALTADFTESFTNCGTAPLTVMFSDTSCTTDSGGITSWAWDFGDGNNSAMQNPTHTYTIPGAYTVSLTVTDASHPAATRTKPSLVIIDAGNDECSGGIPIELGMNGPYNNLCATDSTPAMPCGGTTSNDVWFVYRHFGWDATVEVNTCTGTNYDSKLEVMSGDCTTGLTSVACNDDSCGLQSRVTWAATMGTTYYVRCGGFNGARGTFNLEVKIQGAFSTVAPGCGGTTLTGGGTPAIGNAISLTVAPAAGIAQVIWLGPPGGTPVVYCPGCVQACDQAFLFGPGAVQNVNIPNDLALCGACVCFQASDVGAPGGCNFGFIQFTLSDVLQLLIGC